MTMHPPKRTGSGRRTILRVPQTRSTQLAIALVLVLAAPAHAGLLDFAAPGLAWTDGDVQMASEPVASASQDTSSAAQRDCRTHCESIYRAWNALLAAASIHAELDQVPVLRLSIVQHDDVEAQSLPGGQVILSEQFVRNAKLSEAQIAFVLAHELAHVLHRHERQLLTAALTLLPRGVQRTVKDVYVEMDFNMSLLRTLEVVMHQAEFEADETAMYLCSLAGYQPAETLKFLEAEAASASGAARVLSTHPSASDRLEGARRSVPLAMRLAEHGRRDRSTDTLTPSDPASTATATPRRARVED